MSSYSESVLFYNLGERFRHDVLAEAGFNTDFIPITEAVSGSGGFSRIIEAIGKIIRWIIEKCKSIGRWLKSKFSRNKATATMDQICDDVLPNVSSRGNGNGSKEINIQLSDMDGNPNGKQLKALIRQSNRIRYRIDRRTKDDTLHFKYHFWNGHADRGFRFIVACSERRSTIEEMIVEANTILTSQNINNDAASNLIKRFNNIIGSYNERLVELDMTVLDEVSQILSKLSFNTDRNNFRSAIMPDSNKSTELANWILQLTADTQMAINAATQNVVQLFNVEDKYIGCVEDIYTISKFVKSMIDNNIPRECIMSNTAIVCSKKIANGICVKQFMGTNYVDVDDLAAGQFRLVLFPEDQSIIYKVATSKRGMIDLENEYKISGIFKNVNDEEVTQAIPIHISDEYIGEYVVPFHRLVNGTIGVMDRVNTKINDYRTVDILKIVANALANITGIDLTGDIHDGNVGKDTKTGKYVITDWGYYTKRKRINS